MIVLHFRLPTMHFIDCGYDYGKKPYHVGHVVDLGLFYTSLFSRIVYNGIILEQLWFT